jgi:hypothetical protein
MHTYHLARQHQQLQNEHLAKAAAQFFFPRSLSNAIFLSAGSDISTCSHSSFASVGDSKSSDDDSIQVSHHARSAVACSSLSSCS